MKIQADGLELRGTGNAREHWQQRARRVKKERAAIAWHLAVFRDERPEIPCTFILTRVAPSEGLDFDGLVHSFKGTVDQIAAWMGVDDKHRTLVNYVYRQRKGPWGLEIETQQGIG